MNIAPKINKRKLGTTETTFAALCKRYCGTTTVTFLVRLHGTIDKKLFVQAAHMIFQHHPLLRAVIRKKLDDFYFDLQAQFNDIPIDFVEVKDDTQCISIGEREACTLFDYNNHLWQIKVVRLKKAPEECTLILTSHHSILDGVSAAYVIDELLSYYADLIQGKTNTITSLPLLPAVEDVLDETLIKAFGTPETDARTQKKNSDVTPPPFQTNAPMKDRITRIIYRECDENFLSCLRACCHDEEVTVNAALSAALLLTLQHQRNKIINVSLATAINVRRFCKPEIDNHQMASFSGSILNTCLDISENTSFWNLARSVGQEMKNNFSQSGATPLRLDVESFAKQTHFVADILASNLGYLNFPRTYGPLQLRSLNFFLNEVTGYSQVLFCVASLHGKMFCTFGYTEPLTTKEFAESFADSFIQILEKTMNRTTT